MAGTDAVAIKENNIVPGTILKALAREHLSSIAKQIWIPNTEKTLGTSAPEGLSIGLIDHPHFHPARLHVRDSFVALQEWEGTIVSIYKDYFTARLVDITAEESIASEEADFPLDDIPACDRDLLRPGAIFRWAVGYRRSPGGTNMRGYQLAMRRLPQWTKRELDEAKVEALRIAGALKME